MKIIQPSRWHQLKSEWKRILNFEICTTLYTTVLTTELLYTDVENINQNFKSTMKFLISFHYLFGLRN